MENDIKYRGYVIWHQKPRRYDPTTDWCYMHEQFDGTGSSDDVRAGYEATLEAAKAAIDGLEEGGA